MLSEPDFVDAVQRTLKTGRFLLLVVGDGIRENIEALVGSLHGHPQRHFTFGLVELQVFTDESAPGKHLIVPQVVANTTEIVRAAGRFREMSAEQNWRASSVSIRLPDPGGSRQRLTLFVMTTSGELFTGWLYGQLERIGKSPQLASEYVDDLCTLVPGVERHEKYPDGLSRSLRADEIAAKLDEFIDLVQNLVE